MIYLKTAVLFLVLSSLSACGGEDDPGADGGGGPSRDAGGNDAGGDGGTGGNDAGGNDAGRNDAGGNDAGGSDAGGNDAGGNDAGGNDAGGNDAGRNDAGLDAGPLIPRVTGTAPRNNSFGVPVNVRPSATFNKAMNPLTLNSNSFKVTHDGGEIAGTIAYGPGALVRFTPDGGLDAGTAYVARLTTAVQDTQGMALPSEVVWNFTTGANLARGPAPVLLGAAGDYVILAKTAISTVPASVITGDIAVSPEAATAITNFSLTADATNVFSKSTQVTGNVYAANYAVPTPSNLTTAVSNMETAYTDAAGRVNPDQTNFMSGEIGGETLQPGLYKWTTSITIPASMTFSGDENDVWILQTSGDLVVSNSVQVILGGNAKAENIFWQVAGNASIGGSAHFEGILLCMTDITLETNATMNGRLLSQTAVVLQQATVTQP